MAALTPTLVVSLDASAGNNKIKKFTVTPEADGDTVDFSGYFATILTTTVTFISGMDASLTIVVGSFSGTDVTIVEKKADGATSADDWTGASLLIEVVGTDEGI